MPEQINANLEKAFLNYILQNPSQFFHIQPFYFQNDSIQFIYKVIRDEYITSKDKYIPSALQIATMVRANDPNKERIADDILKFILKGDNSDYNDEYLDKRFKAWKMSNSLKNKVHDTIDKIRGLSEIDYDNVVDVVSEIKSMYGDLSMIDEAEMDLGADFDDPEAHKQELSVNKIPTGWNSLDQITGGGWDMASLVVIMGETNIGKCYSYETNITVRNKKTGEVKSIKVGDFYEQNKSK